MCWMCDHPGSTKHDYLEHVREKMLEHGWAVQYVESDPTPYAYTAGLYECGLPELLVTGLPPQPSARMLNTVGRMTVRDGPPAPGTRIQLPAGPLLEVVEVEHPDAHMNVAVAFFGTDMQALQLVWADRNGR